MLKRATLLSAGLFYACIALAANAVLAAAAPDPDALRAAREGEMRKLVVLDTPRGPYDAAFTGEDGAERHLSDDGGKVLLVNFWAVWCGPCREEMPTLNRLQKEMGGEDFAVVTIALGHNSPAGMKKFFAENGIDALPLHSDPRMNLGRQAGVLGLPVTLILDRDGREIGRLTGGADWSGPEARRIIEMVLGRPEG